MSQTRPLAAIMFTDIAGTTVKDKKIVIYDGGNLVPKAELMKESLIWYDKYLGAVK
jgi:hypothetical protein